MFKTLFGDPNTRKIKKFHPVVAEINALEADIHKLSEDLLLYKIIIDIKLKNIEDAISTIDYFRNKFPNSDLMPYVIYEKKLIDNINNE